MAANGRILEVSQLEPFIHQVGGQSSILQLDEETICKPLIPQECNFYTSIPDILKPFVPDYKGDIEVCFTKDSDGYFALTTADLSDRFPKVCENGKFDSSVLKKNTEERTKCRIHIDNLGSIKIVNNVDSENQVFQEDDNRCISHNPWMLRCLRKQFKRLKENQAISLSSQNFYVKFILLQNLTAKYNFPCIMDLKMGTRQFGDDASLRKRCLIEAKAASTTSKTLGLRHCGMQVYHSNSGHFVCHNKSYGKTLSVEGFKQALHDFLHNGQLIRKDVIPPIIKRLEEMCCVIRELDTFRFYSCSLLVLYEGKEKYSPDFTSLEEESQAVCNSSKNNYNGLTNTKHKIEVQLNEEAHRNRTALVDIRLIDFAHSTHSKLPGNKILHQGPDRGLLFGLTNLISELKIIEKE